MARKQNDYLTSLLNEEEPNPPTSRNEEVPSPSPKRASAALLGRESALARIASGQVRQVTQLLIDPAKVRIWPGNARLYTHLTEDNCRDLIESIIAEGGQKVAAVVRRIENDPLHEYEVIAGTRRHWSISWLRANNYPDMYFLAQVAQLDDEAAFRLADLENRARKDVSDLERARNYAEALHAHYGNHLSRMADRLKLSKGWLSKMIKVASIPDVVIKAFASPDDIKLKPAYPLAQALDDKVAAPVIIAEAKRLDKEQLKLRSEGQSPISAKDVLHSLLHSSQGETEEIAPYIATSRYGRPMLTIKSTSRLGVTIHLHSGSGASETEIVESVRDALAYLDQAGQPLKK